MGFLLPVLIVVTVILAAALVFVILFSRGKEKAKTKGHKLRAKDHASILKEANRRLASNPKDADALLSLAELYYADQDWEHAFKYYEQLVEISAGNPELDEFDIAMKFGLVSLRLNRIEDSYKGLVIARTIKQDNFEVNYNLGYLEYQKRQYEKAIQLLNQAVRQNSEHSLSLRYLGLSMFKAKNFKDALGFLRRAVDLEPDDKEALFTVGECYFELNQLDSALKIFTHLRTDQGLGPGAALFAGTIHLNQRQYQKAIMDFEIGLRHPNIKIETLVELKYRLSAAYLKEQEISKAVALLIEINSLYPNFKDVPAQLQKYRELNSNRNLQTFLLSQTSDFVTLCRKIVVSFYPKAKVKITDISVQKNDYADFLAEIETSKWSDLVMFRFIRTTGIVGELTIRDFHAHLKDNKAGKGLCLTAGTYSDEAIKYVEARLIDLIAKDKLMILLNQIDTRQHEILAN